MLLQVALLLSFLWLTSIPLCVCMHTDHVIFIRSSGDGRLGCFPCLAVVHSAAMNTEVHVSV